MVNKKIIHTLFEQQAVINGTRIAIETENGSERFTYAELNAMANQVAHLLLGAGLSKDDVAAVFFPDPFIQVLALLGIFKSGGIYLAIDKKYKTNHWDVLYNTIRPKVFLTAEEELDMLFQYDAIFDYTIPRVITVARGEDGTLLFRSYEHDGTAYRSVEVQGSMPATNPGITHEPDDANYIFFTSGSTGKPKAVLGCHKSLSHFIHWECGALQIHDGDKIGLLPSFSFDASLQAVFMALINGCVLCLISSETKSDLSGLQTWLRNRQVSVIHLVPTLFRLLSTDWNDDYIAPGSIYPELRYVLSAGEKLYNKDILNWRELHGEQTEVINFYGTTEATILSTWYRVGALSGAPSDVLSVGQPISNTAILILNAEGGLCRVNEVGSIYIRTPFLSKGYYKDPVHTAEKFVQNPLSQAPELVYKTGDYGRYAANRDVQVAGREDGLVKLNGVRIDINTIESTILRLEAVSTVKCLFHQDEQMNASLVCFYKSSSVAVEDLRQHCLRYLSQYETPSLFIRLDQFPINANGKVDPVVLQQKIHTALNERSYEAPRSEVEEKLVQIWSDVLNLKRVSIRDNFQLVGGNSIKLIQLKLRIHRELGVDLSMHDLFNNPVLEEQALLLSRSKKTEYQDIPVLPYSDRYPVSSAQYRLWLLAQFEDGARAYHMPYTITLDGDYDTECFVHAVHATVARHEVLRTVFEFSKEEGLNQVVLPAAASGFAVAYHDFRQEADPAAHAAAYIEEDTYKPFDLGNGPLLRAALIRTADDSHIFYYNLHHIVGDGWSLEVLAKDVMAFYTAFRAATEPGLPELQIQYKDYASWQLKQLASPKLAAARKFWTERFSGVLPILDLPVRSTRPKIKTHNGHRLAGYVPATQLQRLQAFGEQEGGSLFAGLLTLWSILLCRYTAQDDIVIGTPVAGRDHVSLENQIGFYVNTVALRNRIDPQQSFKDCYNQVKERTYEAYDHQMYPFDVLVEDLDLVRDTSRSPLFDCMLTLQNVADRKRNPGLEHFSGAESLTDLGPVASKFDLELFFEETEDALLFSIHYNTDLFEQAFIETLMGSFKEMLAFVTEHPMVAINQIPMLTATARQRLLTAAAGPDVRYTSATVIDLFKAQVVKTPAAVAVLAEGQKLNYEELDSLSDNIAGRLKHTYGVQPGDLVGLQLRNTLWLPAVILGILKSGAAYVPVDVKLPSGRKSFILEDTGLRLLVTEQAMTLAETLPVSKTWTIDTDMDMMPGSGLQEPAAAAPDLPAYVIYTSGSTGMPKGVVVGHGALNNYLNWARELYLDGPLANMDFGLCTSLSFDLTVTSLFLPLISGGTLRLYDTARPVTETLQAYLQDPVSCIKITPAHINLIEALSIPATHLEVAIVGGDELTARHIAILRGLKPGIKIYNEYGPTEATVGCVVYTVPENVEGPVLIGRPMANTTVFICNDQMQLLPAGVPGELCIGGSGLAFGYLGRPELTAGKFATAGFDPAQRLYRTGDRASWTSDGQLAFHGRIDNQVKIQGYRIEPGEIEYFLLQKEGIKEAVVMVAENATGEKALKAFITATTQQTAGELREHMLRYVAEYAVPALFMQLDAMPLTLNGKADRKALSELEGNTVLAGGTAEPPKNEEEKIILGIWTDVMGIADIGTKDDFFSLGGNSIKAVRILHQVNREFETDINMSSLFSYPTIEYLASQVQIARRQQQLRQSVDTMKAIEL